MKSDTFSRYQAFVIAILAILQFTLILDFMVLSPLGAILLDELKISTSQFGIAVSAYAFSAGTSGILAAGFADNYDRKKLLLFFYAGFLLGTLFCALAPTYEFLLLARIVTGLFGGVIGAISFAIITDLFKLEQRGRVMGFVQMAFAASQILGIPIGLMLANRFNWHAPFWLITGCGLVIGLVIVVYLKPVTAHLAVKDRKSPFRHLLGTVSKPDYLFTFLATALLATGGFMMMPFGSAFGIYNLGITMEQLPLLYGITGVFSILFGPLFGKLSDRVGKFKVFLLGTFLSIVACAVYTHLGITPLVTIIGINIVLFAGISCRMISASALTTAIPATEDRGAFMSINSSVQQISGGIASAAAGLIVVQRQDGILENYDILGYVVIASMLLVSVLFYFINRRVERKLSRPAPEAAELAV